MKFETVVGITIFVFLVLIFFGARASINATQEVETNCTETTLVYFDRSGYPRPVYDCAGVDN